MVLLPLGKDILCARPSTHTLLPNPLLAFSHKQVTSWWPSSFPTQVLGWKGRTRQSQIYLSYLQFLFSYLSPDFLPPLNILFFTQNSHSKSKKIGRDIRERLGVLPDSRRCTVRLAKEIPPHATPPFPMAPHAEQLYFGNCTLETFLSCIWALTCQSCSTIWTNPSWKLTVSLRTQMWHPLPSFRVARDT